MEFREQSAWSLSGLRKAKPEYINHSLLEKWEKMRKSFITLSQLYFFVSSIELLLEKQSKKNYNIIHRCIYEYECFFLIISSAFLLFAL